MKMIFNKSDKVRLPTLSTAIARKHVYKLENGKYGLTKLIGNGHLTPMVEQKVNMFGDEVVIKEFVTYDHTYHYFGRPLQPPINSVLQGNVWFITTFGKVFPLDILRNPNPINYENDF